jgi:hypothetical protein
VTIVLAAGAARRKLLSMKMRAKLSLIGAATLGAFAAYNFAVRPWMARWGTTDKEVSAAWPGDELTPATSGRATRAITIHAPAEQVWPWVVQIGQDRAGYYSYTFLENLFRAEMRNTYRIVPEWQTRTVGEDFWMAPKHRYGGQARMIVARHEPRRALVLVHPRDAESAIQRGYAPQGSWNFLLYPVDTGTSRLVMRSIAPEHSTARERFVGYTFWEPAHFIMERKMMLNIKSLAENGRPD